MIPAEAGTRAKGDGMFGRDWESADATIVTRRLIEQGHGAPGVYLSYEVYEYIADVKPVRDARAFRGWPQRHPPWPRSGWPRRPGIGKEPPCRTPPTIPPLCWSSLNE